MRHLLAILILVFIPLHLLGADECFDCHDKYKKTNHGKLDCTACHNDAKDLPHPEKLKKPGCAFCHGEAAKMYETSAHAEKQLACGQCHTVHNLAQGAKKCISCHPSVAHKSLPSTRKHLAAADCTGCHSRSVHGEINVQVNIPQPVLRETIDKDSNNRVDEKEWKDFLAYTQSVVKDTYRITRKYSARGSTHNIGEKTISCNGCHVENKVFQKAFVELVAPGQRSKLILDPHSVIPRLPVSDLYGLTSHGKSGVACRDCHASQGRISDRVCIKCHEKVYNVYKSSAHAKGSAANCTDCHDPHKVKTYKELRPSERITVCTRCHSDYEGKHTWLPHAELHFMYLECSTCHSPRSEKGMVFNIKVRTEAGERNLSYDDIAAAFGTKRSARDLIDRDLDRRIASSEIVPFFDRLKTTTRGTVAIDGSIVVTRVHHDYSEVQKRDKVCTTCHSDDAPFYQSMYLVLPERQGFSHMPVKGTVLASMPSSLALNFILLGETKLRWSDIKTLFRAKGETRREIIEDLRFRWIDIIGIFILIMVLFFIVVHIILRVVFRR
ncbi:MAG: cbcA [Deltaproteobacteria bacterium]|nr:cbcA [Deltaproteobacteria bacterium]